jgi:general secretion pathway protein K
MRNYQPLKNSRGSAIMFSMFMMSLLIFIALEVSKDTVVEYQGSLNSVRRVQAYYAAKSCTDLSMLRIKAYQQTRPLAKVLPDPSMLDMIWQFPLSWPVVLPDGVSSSDKDSVKKSTSTSNFKHQFSSKITGESNKIDINDLGSSSETIRNKTRQQLLNLFQSKVNAQDEWSKKYSNYRFDNLISQISDWIDTDSISQLGGDEGSYYSNMRSPAIPPNQPFKTIEELHMVKDMEDDIFNVLAPVITVYGTKGINVNYADKDLLKALDPRIIDTVADQIIQRRSDIALGGRFKDIKDFVMFLGNYGISEADFNPDKIPLFFDQEINFTISCIGAVGKITREITTVIYDFKKIQSRFNASLAEDAAQQQISSGSCVGKTGDDKYNCLCQTETDPNKKKACVDSKKAADAKTTQDQGTDDTPTPGPPYIIFQDVK